MVSDSLEVSPASLTMVTLLFLPNGGFQAEDFKLLWPEVHFLNITQVDPILIDVGHSQIRTHVRTCVMLRGTLPTELNKADGFN